LVIGKAGLIAADVNRVQARGGAITVVRVRPNARVPLAGDFAATAVEQDVHFPWFRKLNVIHDDEVLLARKGDGASMLTARGIDGRLLLEVEEVRIKPALHRWGNALA